MIDHLKNYIMRKFLDFIEVIGMDSLTLKNKHFNFSVHIILGNYVEFNQSIIHLIIISYHTMSIEIKILQINCFFSWKAWSNEEPKDSNPN